MRQMLVKDFPLKEIITTLQKVRVTNFDELKSLQENDPKLWEIRQIICRGKGPMYWARMEPWGLKQESWFQQIQKFQSK